MHADAEPAGLCDLVDHEAWVRFIVENQVMETLFEQSESGTITPRLAERWAWVGEGAQRQLVIELRHNVHFHDGHPLTASDVVWTLQRAADPKLGADQRSDLDPVAAIDATNDHTVALRVPRPAPFLEQALAHIVIYPRHLVEGVDLRSAPFCRAPIGSGPFRVAHWDAGRSLALSRVDDYWGERALLDRVELHFVRDHNAARLLYDRGELDVLALRQGDRPPSGRIYRYTPRAFYFALWNTRRPGLASPKVRVALSHVFDLPRFVDVAFGGHARPHSGPFVEGTPSYDPAITPWSYEPQPIPDAPRTLTFLSTVGSQSSDKLATLLEEDLRRVGIKLVIEKLDFARVLERLRRHDFDVAALQLSLALEQDNYGLFHSRAVDEQNWGGLADPEIDKLLETIRETDDAGLRHAHDRRLHALLHQRGSMTFLVAPEVDLAVAPNVSVRPSSDGFDLAHAFRIGP